MDALTPVEIGRKMDALAIWDSLLPFNWIVKPAGTVFPYFCTSLKGEAPHVKVRFLMLEGWQTFHDYIHTRVDRNFGVYSTPMEMPHFEMVVSPAGDVHIFRHDPGYMPRALSAKESELCAKVLWEAYGVMMRLETDQKLPLKYAAEKAMFARIQDASGNWVDSPMEIPPMRPYVEEISFSKASIAKAKDMPIAEGYQIELDFRLIPNVMTREERARCAYELLAVNSASGERVFSDRTSVVPDAGLKGMWLAMPSRVLERLIEGQRLPSQIKVTSGRVFRLLRFLCHELPIKLSLHDRLECLEESYGKSR